MKHKLLFGITLLAAALFWMGCPPDDLDADYALNLPDSMDSVQVEWVYQGASERESRFFEKDSEPWPEFIYFAFTVDPDPDNPDAALPSRVFDSLFVYQTALGQTSMVYSGVNDADWEVTEFDKNRRRYTLPL